MEHDPLNLRTVRKSPRLLGFLRSRYLVASSAFVASSTPFGARCTTAVLLSFLVSIGSGTLQKACAQEKLGLGAVSLIGQIQFDSPIIPARPGALDGGNPIEGLGRPDDPNPSRVGDYKPKGTKASDSSSYDSEGKTESSLGRNEPSDANSDLSGNGSSQAKNESAEARNESAEARNESLEAKSEFDEPRKESAEGKHEFAEGQGETKNAYNEDAEASSDTAEPPSGSSESPNSSHSIRKRTRSLVPVLDSPQPGQTIRKGGFTNFAKEQAASQQIHDELYEAEKARIKSAAKKSDGKADAGKAGKADGNAPRKLSQVDSPASKSGKGSRRSKQELVPPPPPYTVPLVSQSKETPERKALELITNKKYATAESRLQDLLSDNPDNCHARYLLGVALVMQRKYDEAKKEYSFVIEHSTDEKLIDLATQGLQKL